MSEHKVIALRNCKDCIHVDVCRYRTDPGSKDCICKHSASDVRPVVRGRWEIVTGSNGKEHMVCTNCRVQQDLTGVFSFCPNCGAEMRGGEND